MGLVIGMISSLLIREREKKKIGEFFIQLNLIYFLIIKLFKRKKKIFFTIKYI